MKTGFNLGKIFGISIMIDVSWLLIFALVTLNLAGSIFPGLHPTWSVGLNLVTGVIASLLFFASVLAHELAHSVVARKRGVPVRRITLFLFGGISDIEREPPSPGSEFVIAIVGPLTSLVLGIVFSLLGAVNAAKLLATPRDPNLLAAQLDPFSTLLLWLGPINIILGVFNLIPGFPLDGGRVLRSIIWAITHNLRQATRWASRIGQLIAWLFILGGVGMIFGLQIPFFGRGFLSGLWLVFIGWFLNNAAIQSYQQAVNTEMLEGVPVARLMYSQGATVSPDLTIIQLVDNYLIGTDERAFPVLEGDRLVGLVCLEDVRTIPRTQWNITPVSQIMTPTEKLDTVSPREQVNDALRKLEQHDERQVPVVQDGHLVGMLRQRDIVRWLSLHSEGAWH